ncbi:unnamed protein product, partial [marine sediment metagenome]
MNSQTKASKIIPIITYISTSIHHLLYVDLVLAAVIDEDELTTGIRREGGYYGINALITKLSTILIFLTISIVFTSVGWAVFDPLGTTEQTIFGLRSLMFIFPAIALF